MNEDIEQSLDQVLKNRERVNDRKQAVCVPAEIVAINENNKTQEIELKQTVENEKHDKSSQEDAVSCKAKNLAPIRTTREKCEIIQGVIVYD